MQFEKSSKSSIVLLSLGKDPRNTLLWQNMRSGFFSKLSCLMLAVFMAGCSLAPDYQRPETAAPPGARYINADPEQPGDPGDLETARWWKNWDDPVLDAYVEQLLADNLELRAAAARLVQAWERRQIEYGALIPTIGADLSANRSFRPSEDFSNIFGGGGGGGGTTRIHDTSIEAALSTSWQFDLFGRIRNASASAGAGALATAADNQALRQSLIAELARRRVAMGALQDRIEQTAEIIRLRRKTLDVVEGRYKRGVAQTGAADVHLARENLASAAAQLPALQADLREQAYGIDILLGRKPGHTMAGLEQKKLAPVPPRAVPAGLPAQLLDRRPDLRANELRVIAAHHDIGVAIADLFPDLSLTGSIGLEDESFGSLVSSDRLTGNIIGQIVTNLFQGGRLQARIRLEKAEAEELAAIYAQNVLQAIREVETALLRESRLSLRIAELENSVAAIGQSEKVASDRYSRGVGELLNLLEIRTRQAAARQDLITARQAKWNARIDLFLALGGDWVQAQQLAEVQEAP